MLAGFLVPWDKPHTAFFVVCFFAMPICLPVLALLQVERRVWKRGKRKEVENIL